MVWLVLNQQQREIASYSVKTWFIKLSLSRTLLLRLPSSAGGSGQMQVPGMGLDLDHQALGVSLALGAAVCPG